MNGEDLIAAVASNFHFTEAEVMGMSATRLIFWNEQAKKIHERKQS